MSEITEISEFIKYLDTESNLTNKSSIIPLIEKSNKYITILNKNISENILLLKNSYSSIFPELPSIVTDNYEYVKSIEIIQLNKNLLINDLKSGLKILNEQLSFLPNNVLMALTFMLTSSNIMKPISKESENSIHELYEKLLNFFNYKTILLNFISNNMEYLAPNLTALLGSEIAAKLISEAGGLDELAKTPSGNILNMGRHELNLEGFSTMNKFNNGYLTELNEYKNAINSMKIKILRRYANKTALAARKDAFMVNDNNNNEKYGENIKKVIFDKIEKIKNDVQPVLKKPLPRPDAKPRRKRGGKRVRGLKKKFELTEVRKLKNRMKFGEPENEYRDTGLGFGMLGVGGIGSSIRVTSNKNNKIMTKKQKILDQKYGSVKETNVNTGNDKNK